MGWKRQASGLQLSPGCRPSPNGTDSLDGNVPKVVPKVTGSGGLSLIPGVSSTAFFIPQEPGAAGEDREGRREQEEGRVHGQQQRYGWLRECEVKGSSGLFPTAPCSA